MVVFRAENTYGGMTIRHGKNGGITLAHIGLSESGDCRKL